jgi:hypothetical protein
LTISSPPTHASNLLGQSFTLFRPCRTSSSLRMSNQANSTPFSRNNPTVCREKPPSRPRTEEEITARCKELMNKHKVVLFMKGNPSSPKCGFSRQTVGLWSGGSGGGAGLGLGRGGSGDRGVLVEVSLISLLFLSHSSVLYSGFRLYRATPSLLVTQVPTPTFSTLFSTNTPLSPLPPRPNPVALYSRKPEYKTEECERKRRDINDTKGIFGT